MVPVAAERRPALRRRPSRSCLLRRQRLAARDRRPAADPRRRALAVSRQRVQPRHGAGLHVRRGARDPPLHRGRQAPAGRAAPHDGVDRAPLPGPDPGRRRRVLSRRVARPFDARSLHVRHLRRARPPGGARANVPRRSRRGRARAAVHARGVERRGHDDRGSVPDDRRYQSGSLTLPSEPTATSPSRASASTASLSVAAAPAATARSVAARRCRKEPSKRD